MWRWACVEPRPACSTWTAWRRASAIFRRPTGCTSTLHAPVWTLAVGERQRVEIIKALYRGADLLILDEPTAVLTPQEVDDLFVTLRTA
jgi:ABC-type uncharacterized transport system ATPase subunit